MMSSSAAPELSSPIRWQCTFEGRAGRRAHATFTSVDEARAFAERHAQAGGTGGEWVEAASSWLLTTPVGSYKVALT